MRAVCERLQYYAEVRTQTLTRVATHLEGKFDALATEMLGQSSRFSRPGCLVWEAHSEQFGRLQPYAPLLRVMKANALGLHIAMRRKYASAMQRVYRKEITNYFKAAKRFVEVAHRSRDTGVLLGSTHHGKNLNLLVQGGSMLQVPHSAARSVASSRRSSVSSGWSESSDHIHSTTSQVHGQGGASPLRAPHLSMYRSNFPTGADSVASTVLEGEEKLRPDIAFAQFVVTTALVVARERDFCSSFFDLLEPTELDSMLKEMCKYADDGGNRVLTEALQKVAIPKTICTLATCSAFITIPVNNFHAAGIVSIPVLSLHPPCQCPCPCVQASTNGMAWHLQSRWYSVPRPPPPP